MHPNLETLHTGPMKQPIISLSRNSESIRSIYVFGQRNSGTNFINNLILKNCLTQDDQKRLYDPRNAKDFGWKHGFPNIAVTPDDVLAIVVYREPVAWLQSLHRLPWHTIPSLQNLSFSEFIRAEWVSVFDDPGFGVARDHPLWGTEMLSERDPKTRLRFANAIRMRNAKIVGFNALKQNFENCLFLRYEDIVADPCKFLAYLSEVYGFARKPQFEPVVYDRGTKSRGQFQPKPISQISSVDMDFIRNELDQGQERRLGYDISGQSTPIEARVESHHNSSGHDHADYANRIQGVVKHSPAKIHRPDQLHLVDSRQH